MAKTKDTIVPYFPKDFSTQQLEVKAAAGANHTPGALVIVDNATGQSILCDGATALHNAVPKLIVLTDSSTRSDANVIRLDGTVEQTETCIAGVFKADVSVTLFTSAPAPGDFIIASETVPGKFDAVDTVGAPDPLSVIGRVQGTARKPTLGANFVDCSFNLG